MEEFNILIVNDSFSSRLLLGEICEVMGYKYTFANNGKESIDILEEKDFNAVLMDIEMPVMNGFEATRHIRENMKKPKCDIPIIAITAHHPRHFFDEYTDIKFDEIIPKPFSLEDVQDVLQRFCENINTNF